MAKRILLTVMLAVALIYCCTSDSNVKADSDSLVGAERTEVWDVDNNPYLVLVNKEHCLPDGWEDSVEIETETNFLGEEMQIDHRAYVQFMRMREMLLLKYDIQIELDSVYRSVDEQEELWKEFTEEYGEDYAKQYLAVPGCSEHHTGLAVDIFLVKNGIIIRENDDMIADKEDFEVIHEMLPKYGFILRYPEGKEEITGYAYEPWHLRYLDNAIIAQEITDEGLTLEEYLQK